MTGTAAAVGSVALPSTGGTGLGAEWAWAPLALVALGVGALLVSRRRHAMPD